MGRLQWRCRRGTKELDRILGAFLEQEYQLAGEAMQAAFAALLEHQDPDIYDWLMGASVPDAPETKEIINRLRQKFGLLRR